MSTNATSRVTSLYSCIRCAGIFVAAVGTMACGSAETTPRVFEDPRPIGSVADLKALRERSDINILFVLVDTLRADHLGVYGHHNDTSPAIDYLAQSGIRFARHQAQSSWTKCSMASLWTASYPQRTGVLRFDDALPDAARLPAEILKEAGYRTIALYRNGWVAPNFGFAQGFDTYERPFSLPPSREVRKESPTLTLQGTDVDVLDSAYEFLYFYGEEKWFLYLHLMDVHQYLYDADTALFGTSYAGSYDNSIRRESKIINNLVVHLADKGLLDRTLIVIASDHGEAFGERGLEGHARFVYRETTEVPLVMSMPFLLPTDVVVTERTRNIDVWPTLLDLLGLEEMADVDGVSRLPDIVAAASGAEAPNVGPSFSQLDYTWGQPGRPSRATLSIADGPLRYVYLAPSGDQPGREELFDASGDPSELRDLADAQPDAMLAMRQLRDAYLNENTPSAWGETPKVELDEMELNQLRALGYMEE